MSVDSEKQDVELIKRELNLLSEIENLTNSHRLHYDELKAVRIKMKEMAFWMGQLKETLEERIKKYGKL